MNLHEFIDLKLVQALRWFLWSFWLLGKVQKMDQMMKLGGRWVKTWKVEDPQKLHYFELYNQNKGQLIKACKTKADGHMVEWKHFIYSMSAPTCA